MLMLNCIESSTRPPPHHLVPCCCYIGDLAESAVHSDHRVEAQALMAELQPLVEHTQSSWIQMAMRFARAQLADDGEADTVFQEALIFPAQASGNDPQSVPGFVYIQLVPERIQLWK